MMTTPQFTATISCGPGLKTVTVPLEVHPCGNLLGWGFTFPPLPRGRSGWHIETVVWPPFLPPQVFRDDQ